MIGEDVIFGFMEIFLESPTRGLEDNHDRLDVDSRHQALLSLGTND